MKIAVIGAGALGTLYGALLADGGNEVWLLHHRAGYTAAINDRGVAVDRADDPPLRVDVPATTDASDVGPADLAIVLVRAYQTVEAVAEHDACIGPGTRVLSLQNGLTNHRRLAAHVGADRALSGVTYQGATLDGPGRVTQTSDGPTVFGGPDEAFAERVAATFEAAGLSAEIVPDPLVPIWRKQLWGVAIKPVAALTRLSNRELVAGDATTALMRHLVREAAAVAHARGIDLDAAAVFSDLEEALARSTHTSSMLQDVRAGRRTEIDDVNGAIVDLAAEEGIAVPANETVTALVRGLDRRDEGPIDPT